MTASPQALAALGMPPSQAAKVGIESPVTLAATGDSQATAAPISAQVTYVLIDTDNGNWCVRLPRVATAPYDEYIVCNGADGGAGLCQVFAAVGDEIAALGILPMSLEAGGGTPGMSARFRKLDANRWMVA